MNYTEFRKRLLAMGFSVSAVVRLSELGFQSAMDAHGDMREEIETLTGGTLESYCKYIGRGFVLDNLDMFAEMLEG